MDSNWTTAEQNCEKAGAHLASIHSEEEHEFVADNFAQQHFWIGAKDVKDSWHWSVMDPGYVWHGEEN